MLWTNFFPFTLFQYTAPPAYNEASLYIYLRPSCVDNFPFIYNVTDKFLKPQTKETIPN